jgi:hypothetical protein
MSAFEQIAEEMGKLVAMKNAAYGDAWARSGHFLKLLYPDGVKPEQYTDMLLLVRIFDKMMRIATDKDAFGESPFRDIIGYGILGSVATRTRPPLRGQKEGGHTCPLMSF